MEVYIAGAATSKFGELWDIGPRELVSQVVSCALTTSSISAESIEACMVGNMLSGALGRQDHLGAFFSEELGISGAAMRVEGACASGGLAVHAGVSAILSGLYETVLVIGVEKMSDNHPSEVAAALMGAGSEAEREAGATFPALYALMARAHMQKYGTSERQMASVAVKNHYHASLNSHAQYRKAITIEEVLASPMVASPLRLLDCSPISDGASAVILTGNKKHLKNKSKNIVSVVASNVATDTLGLSERSDLTTLTAALSAAKKAYKKAAIGPGEIDVCEVHDCFTIAEIIAMEDLGFFKKGEAADAIERGKTTLGRGKLVVNTSGGLKACGHPVGATGVKQIVEIFEQLMEIAGNKQVPHARIGLTHNVGGSGATAVVHILKSLK